MSLTKFCSSCGEAITGRRLRVFSLMALCRGCRKRAPAVYLAQVVLLSFCLLTGFFIGRLTQVRRPLTLLGTPVDPSMMQNSLTNERTLSSTDQGSAPIGQRPRQSEPQNSPAEESINVCGAPTKAGRPCRRKVRGGGYCWQHKDKGKAKPSQALPGSATQPVP
jgi:hypothetical protein